MHVVWVERLLLLLSVFCSSYPLARPSLPPPVQLFPFFIILVSMVWVGFFILTNWYTTFDIFLTEVGCTHTHILTDSRTSALTLSGTQSLPHVRLMHISVHIYSLQPSLAVTCRSSGFLALNYPPPLFPPSSAPPSPPLGAIPHHHWILQSESASTVGLPPAQPLQPRRL